MKITELNGLQIDFSDCWSKIIGNTHKDPLTFVTELFQNAIDGYPNEILAEDRTVEINYDFNQDNNEYFYECIDYGEGFSIEKFLNLITLGGSDKTDFSDIGKFGIGFKSIFDPRNKPKKIIVESNCEGERIRLTIKTDEKNLPELMFEEIPYVNPNITKVKATFDKNGTIILYRLQQKLEQLVKYHPAELNVNGTKLSNFKSVDHFTYKNENASFKGGVYDKLIISKSLFYDNIVIILVGGIKVIGLRNLNHLAKGNEKRYETLKDLEQDQFPYIDFPVEIIINWNNLKLTSDRDSFYPDYKWIVMKTFVQNGLIKYLKDILVKRSDRSDDLIFGNLYVYRNFVKKYFNNEIIQREDIKSIVEDLANEKIFTRLGDRKKHSLFELNELKNHEFPLYIAYNEKAANWLQNEFTHDFVIIVKSFYSIKALNFKELYPSVFSCISNQRYIKLDDISKADLEFMLKQGYITEQQVNPKFEIIKKRLSSDEKILRREIIGLFKRKDISNVIQKHIGECRIKPVFFTRVSDDKILAAFLDKSKSLIEEYQKSRLRIMLGFNTEHRFFQEALNSKKPNRVNYLIYYFSLNLEALTKNNFAFRNLQIDTEQLNTDLRRALIINT